MKNSERLQKELEQVQQDIEAMMNRRNSGVNDETTSFQAYCRLDDRRTTLRDQIMTEKNRELEVGDGCTVRFYTDRHACTVIKKTKTTITVQRDKATLDPNWKPEWVEGGFSAICTNQEDQTYTYERNPKGETYTLRWNEKAGRYINHTQGIRVYPGRHEFYDYNF